MPGAVPVGRPREGSMVAVRHVLASAATGNEDGETVIAWTDGFLW